VSREQSRRKEGREYGRRLFCSIRGRPSIILQSNYLWHTVNPGSVHVWHCSSFSQRMASFEGMTACGTKRGEVCHHHYTVKMLRGPRTNKAFFGSYLHCFVARQKCMEVSQIVEMRDAAAKLSSTIQSVKWKV